MKTLESEGLIALMKEKLDLLDNIRADLDCNNSGYIRQTLQRILRERDELRQWQADVIEATGTSNRARAMATVKSKFSEVVLGPEWDESPPAEFLQENGITNAPAWTRSLRRFVADTAEKIRRLDPNAVEGFLEFALSVRHEDGFSLEEIKELLNDSHNEVVAAVAARELEAASIDITPTKPQEVLATHYLQVQ